MFYQIVVLLCLYYITIFLTLCNAITNSGEYAIIKADVEYVPTNVSIVLDNVNAINSLAQCSIKCKFNELCLTATYYEDLKLCRLFSAHNSQGTLVGRVNVTVIDMVDRGKK
jgi:hypothetical protein